MKKIFGILFILVVILSLSSCSDIEDNLEDEKTIVVPTEIEELEFLDKTFVYDGTVKSLDELKLPKGYTAKYYNNEQTEVGEYVVRVRIRNKDGEIVTTLKAKLTIVEPTSEENEKDLTKVKFKSQTFTYDGSIKALYLEGLPIGYDVEYINNYQTEVGLYVVIANILDKDGNLVLELSAILTIEEDNSIPTNDYTYHVVGGYYDDWSNYTNENQMKSLTLNELYKYYPQLYNNLESYDVKSIYVLEDRIFDYKGNWISNVYDNWNLTSYDGGFTLKVVEACYDSFDLVYYANRWIPDPITSHVGNLSPYALYIPEWVEENQGYGNWADNPVITSGAGIYSVVMVEYNRVSTEDQTGFALGVVKNVNLEDSEDAGDFYNLLNKGYATDPGYVKLDYLGSELNISYDKNNYSWTSVKFETPVGLSSYKYLNYTFTFNESQPLLLKLEGNSRMHELWIYHNGSGYIDLSLFTTEFLNQVHSIIIFPAAGMEYVSGNIKVSDLNLSKDIGDSIYEEKFYLRGNMNEWAVPEEYRLIPNIAGYYEITTYLEAYQDFKIATEDWTISYGYDSISVVDDRLFKSNNGNIYVTEAGTYKFVIINGLIHAEPVYTELEEEYKLYSDSYLNFDSVKPGYSTQLPTSGLGYSDIYIDWNSSNECISIDEYGNLTVLDGYDECDVYIFANLYYKGESMSKQYIIHYFKPCDYSIIGDPVQGKTYKLVMYQGNLKKDCYLDGSVSGDRFLNTTNYASSALDFYVLYEDSKNFYIYTYIDGYQNFINLTINNEGRTVLSYSTEKNTLWTFDIVIGYIYTDLNDNSYYMGSYNEFSTVSASKIKFVNNENVGVTQFVLQFAEINDN